MCTPSVEVDVKDITGTFDLSIIKTFNMYFLTKYILPSISSQVNFCMEVGLLPKARACTYCKRPMNLTAEKGPDHATPIVYRCYNRGCRKNHKCMSVRECTIFDSSKYINGVTTYEQLRRECVDETGSELSRETISDW